MFLHSFMHRLEYDIKFGDYIFMKSIIFWTSLCLCAGRYAKHIQPTNKLLLMLISWTHCLSLFCAWPNVTYTGWTEMCSSYGNIFLAFILYVHRYFNCFRISLFKLFKIHEHFVLYWIHPKYFSFSRIYFFLKCLLAKQLKCHYFNFFM